MYKYIYIYICVCVCIYNYLFFITDTKGRKRLVLTPRTVQDPVNSLAETTIRNSIYGGAKPREEKITDNNEVK
jgi:hypothetical protein